MAKTVSKKTASQKTPKVSAADSPMERLLANGAAVPSARVMEAAMDGDLDVTDTDEAELGTYIKTNVRSGLTCVLYPAGNRVMMSVH